MKLLALVSERTFTIAFMVTGMCFRMCLCPSRAHVEVLHQEFILSLSGKQHIDEITVLHVLVTVLLLEYHVGRVESLEIFLNHLEFSDDRVTKAKLCHDTVNRSIICLNCLEVEEAELCPITPGLWEKHCLLLAKVFLKLHPQYQRVFHL